MPKLKCEQHTKAMEKRILAAYRARYGVRKISAFYEHGQWWIYDQRHQCHWSVNDAEGRDSINGFCFEQVTDAIEA